MDKHNGRWATLTEREPDLKLTAEELIAEHTGDVRWLSVPKNEWVARLEQAS